MSIIKPTSIIQIKSPYNGNSKFPFWKTLKVDDRIQVYFKLNPNYHYQPVVTLVKLNEDNTVMPEEDKITSVSLSVNQINNYLRGIEIIQLQ